jgi:hypothetical protein
MRDSLYAEADKLLGAKGITDTVVLVGIYDTVCAILNAFEIPALSSTPLPAVRGRTCGRVVSCRDTARRMCGFAASLS